MMTGDIIAFGIPLTIFLVSGFATHWLAKNQSHTALKWVGSFWLLTTFAMLIGVSTLGSWDGLIYVAILIGISAPAGLGGLIGGLVGRFRAKKVANV